MKTLDIENNDLVYENGNLVMATGIDAIKIIMANRLKLWLGEWSLAPNSGVDWLGLMNQSNAVDPVRRIEAALRDAILADSRITKISSMDISFDRSTRTISATIGMITDGEAIEVNI